MADEVQTIKSRIDIVDIVGEYVSLKRAGRNFKGVCPFHQEKTPSFMVNPEIQIYKCFGCFPAGQHVKTPFGEREIQNINKGEYVFSGKGMLQKVEAVYKRNYKGDIIAVKVSNLTEEVFLTGDHNVYIVGGSKLYKNNYKYLSRKLNKYKKYPKSKELNKLWKYHPISVIPARDLGKGMSLLYPIDSTVTDVQSIDLASYITKKWPKHGRKPASFNFNIRINKSFLRILGYYIAEGSSSRAYIRFSLGGHEMTFAKDIVRLLRSTFNIDASIHVRSRGNNDIEVTACNSMLANIFENLCGKGAANKHVPYILQQINLKKQSILLEAIFRGDGHIIRVSASNKIKNERRSITTISRTLSEQMTDILLRLGYFPSRGYKEQKVDKKGVNHSASFTLNWSTNPAVSKRKHFYVDKNNNKYWILPILHKSSKNFKGYVYNLRIKDDHSFVVNSFAVSNCGEAGDIFTFLQKHENLEFYEALQILAKRAGVTLTQHDSGVSEQKEKIRNVNFEAARFYHYILTKHADGKKALAYLTKQRGLTLETIREFNLGYAPDKWSVLFNFLSKKKGFEPKLIEESGLVYKGRGGYTDRFRGRIIFVILDHRQNTIALAGRILPELADKGLAKYINSPETLIYKKSESLYGIEHAKSHIKKSGTAVLVEGDIDMLSSWQADVKNSVAIKGTAITVEQVKLISRFTDTIIFALDSDFAGDKASLKGIVLAQNENLEVKVADMGKYKDPDEFAIAEPEKYRLALKQAQGVWDFLLELTEQNYDFSTGVGKSKASKFLLPFLVQIEDQVLRDHYISEFARKIGVSPQVLYSQIKTSKFEFKSDKKTEHQSVNVKNVVKSRRELLEEDIVRLALTNFPEKLLESELRECFKTSFSKRIASILEKSLKSNNFKLKNFSEEMPEKIKTKLCNLLLTEDNGNSGKDFNLAVYELKLLDIKEEISNLVKKIGDLEEKGNTKASSVAQRKFKKLTQILKKLEESKIESII